MNLLNENGGSVLKLTANTLQGCLWGGTGHNNKY